MMRKLQTLEITYVKGNCEKNPFVVTLEPPLLAQELHLVELPSAIRNEIMNSLDAVLSEYYFEEIKLTNYSFYK